MPTTRPNGDVDHSSEFLIDVADERLRRADDFGLRYAETLDDAYDVFVEVAELLDRVGYRVRLMAPPLRRGGAMRYIVADAVGRQAGSTARRRRDGHRKSAASKAAN